MTHTTHDYILELDRELRMREQVYPGRVRTRKMTQAAADRKTELMRQVRAIFYLAQECDLQPDEIKLPFTFTGAPFPTTTLEPHIREVQIEIEWRVQRFGTLTGAATKEHALYQLDLMRHILQALQKIQGTYINQTTQTTLF